MKLAIMQPYLFPYLGYFKLIDAVDKFVFYDDVNFIKNGWINRNRLLISKKVNYLTIPLSGMSSSLKINQVMVQGNERWRKKILQSVRQSYSKAPHFKEVNNILSEVLFSKENYISDMAKKSIILVSQYLELETQFIISSSHYNNMDLNGVDRVIDICHKEKATEYYNLPGGSGLYDDNLFEFNKIKLYFIKPFLSQYQQFSEEFVSGLSVIDVLMFNDKCTAREMLHREGG
ncbi:MAG: hypothetical protein GQ532_06400 [Methylomarinum sp.]|nr:hypothetical protein [Methylomarinum sp.]